MIPGFTRITKCKGLQKSFKTVDLYLPKLVVAGRRDSTLFGVVDDEIYW